MRTLKYARSPVSAAAVTLLLAGTAACGGGDTTSDSEGEQLEIITNIYPMQWLAERIGGDAVTVTNVVEIGAEPHDTELSPRQIGAVSEADLNFYISTLQPSMDDAVSQAGGDNALDALTLVELLPFSESDQHVHEEEHADEGDHAHESEEGQNHESEEGHAHEGEETHATEEDHAHESEEGHAHGADDPHVWNDPVRMATIAGALGERLGEIDPDRASAYADRAAEVEQQLNELDTEFSETLSQCQQDLFVTNHTSFRYLADRYDLRQLGISGLKPDTEPSPARLAEVTEIVREHDIDTIFTEALTSPKVAEVLANEAGVETDVLDPLAGLTEQQREDGEDYLSVQRANLDALSGALDCQ
ncbi:metal ABC transporter substrate-binding protein [Salinactinospora qingdaonensis]|uniref:Metal ABC transporter substrate-binding protein n=1 Tax=Salinactinospora qingdaonensis TaxID=702744 RepID=A0ABP7GE32_9ACTN